MIIYKIGNILEAKVEALVNTVNTLGVMGKGIALQFKTTFPENFKAYADAVKNGEVRTGKMLIIPVNHLHGVKYIINFPTKENWRNPSQLEWIESGLEDLCRQIISHQIQSIAIPPLGCGNGKLRWEDVKPLIEKHLGSLDCEVVVYQPSEEIRQILAKEERSEASRLTPVRAMMLTLLYRYRALGEFASEFAAEKLTYFLQRFGETQTKLKFQKGVYGPYSGQVRHVLFTLNGYFLKGFEQKDSKPFAPLELMVERKEIVDRYIDSKLSPGERERMKDVSDFIQGFETPYGLELLATVDYLINEHQTFQQEIILKHLQLWSERKFNVFSQEHISLAIGYLSQFKEKLYPNF